MYDCTGCAKCCKTWDSPLVSAGDLSKWEGTAMADYVVDGKIWFDPQTAEKLPVCPFLESNRCSIYPEDGEADMRPEICGKYPGDKPCLQEQMQVPTTSRAGGFRMNVAAFTRRRPDMGDQET